MQAFTQAAELFENIGDNDQAATARKWSPSPEQHLAPTTRLEYCACRIGCSDGVRCAHHLHSRRSGALHEQGHRQQATPHGIVSQPTDIRAILLHSSSKPVHAKAPQPARGKVRPPPHAPCPQAQQAQPATPHPATQYVRPDERARRGIHTGQPPPCPRNAPLRKGHPAPRMHVPEP